MIVELFGLPGSGKTHVATALESDYDWPRASVRGFVPVVWYFMCGALQRPGYFMYGMWHAFVSGQPPARFWNLGVLRYAKYAFAVQHSGKVVILDEGPLQNILSYPKQKLSVGEINNVIKRLPKSDFLIFFDVPKQVREERYKERGYASWRKQGAEDTHWDTVMQENFDTLKKIAQGQKNVLVVTENVSVTEVMYAIEAYAHDSK